MWQPGSFSSSQWSQASCVLGTRKAASLAEPLGWGWGGNKSSACAVASILSEALCWPLVHTQHKVRGDASTLNLVGRGGGVGRVGLWLADPHRQAGGGHQRPCLQGCGSGDKGTRLRVCQVSALCLEHKVLGLRLFTDFTSRPHQDDEEADKNSQ